MTETSLKIGVVGIPGKWSTEVLADAIEAQTGFRLVIDIEQVIADLGRNRVTYQDHCLCDLDAIVVKKISQTYSPTVIDRLEILRFVEKCGVQVFSKPSEIIRLVDRMSCTISLTRADVPMPPTLITENLDAALTAVEDYDEAILKPLFSTKARGMEVLKAKDGSKKLRQQLQAYYDKQGFFYLQKKLNLPGQDMGLVFLGGEYLGAYARISGDKSWNTTIYAGGKYAPASPCDDTIAIARQAQAQFDLSYTTVDMAETEDGPVCFEVSAFGGFKGAQEGLQLDIAQRYTQFVLDTLRA
ncbi:GAK system ATP-grasp enzyme [Thiomicrospira sp. WB1]|uniref:GAK system ATP-grasp enzyme n=1 Tax=Thiomicrospira sp. WB1 TaxID=1685380 RepID=UPI0007476E91|nr:GAK system ATP-grasp enzyme [Thiomicrospira sp. WB1]KUJ71742.1 glutathione synthase [Thiomicrospira sp. WB1]